MDFAAHGLLDGLEGPDRASRERLLERLLAAGASLEELQNGTQTGTLVFLGADREIGGSQVYTLDEVCSKVGVEIDFARATIRAAGIAVPPADERALSELDLELLSIGANYRALGLADEDVIEVARVLARGLGPVAETMRRIALKSALRPGASEDDLAVDFAQVADQLLPSVEPLLSAMMRLQLHNVVQSEVISAAEREAGQLRGAREVVVCFADLVGFTRVGEDVPADELGRIATRLEQLAAESVEHPVRVVKSIGDAVMLVSPDVQPMVDCALALTDAAEAEGDSLPQLRVGIASGQALRRASDWYGHPVNLASRITAVARPGSVLVAKEVEAALEPLGRYKLSFAGARRLKGIREPVPLHRVRRAESEA
ncbi:MAG: adenylate/guanylate cyclase domain-containing protein [Solirubrobacteraceae bacterium]